MKLTKLFFLFLLSAVMISSYAAEKRHTNVNEIIGDLSFIHKFGHKPGKETDEVLRIQTHLEFVETLLRNKRVSHLTPAQKKSRTHLLDLLHTYWNAGIFPRNYDYEGRRISCFIDKENRICAVGFLIEQTAGHDVAEDINTKFKYSNILDMDDPTVENWIASSGLTKLECAMIQPTYGYEYYNNPEPTPSYGYEHYNPEPTPVNGTPSVVYVRDTKEEHKLRAELDSQAVVIGYLTEKTDSLNQELEVAGAKTDSLKTLSEQNKGEINQLKINSKTQVSIIWTLSAALGAALIFGLIKWLRPASVSFKS